MTVTLLPVLASFLIGATGTEPPKPMSFLDLMNVPALSDPQVSPDGRQIAYVRDLPDWTQDRRIGHIWRIPVTGGEAQQLTRGTRGESSPRWSPDGQLLAFLARRDGDDDNDEQTQAYVLPTGGGEARPATAHATPVSAIQWSPDGSRLYFLASDPKPADLKAREARKDDVYAFDENYTQRHLWYVTVATGTEGRLTQGDFSVLSYRVSPDGASIVIERAPTPLLGDAEHGEVAVLPSAGGDPRILTSNDVAESDASFSPDGRTLLFLAGANARFETYYQSALFTIPVAGGQPHLALPAFPYEILEAEWKDEGTVFLVANLGIRTELFEVSLAHPDQPRRLTTGDHALHDWTFAPKPGVHVFELEEAERPGEVWTLTSDTTQSVKQPIMRTNEFGDLTKRFKIARQEAVTWKSSDGQEIEGLLFYPVGYETGHRYPLAVQTHGGPASSDKFGWGSRMSYAQVLAGKGYAVFRPNYRGSTGYGNPFLRDMVGDYFRHAHEDVLTGVDALVARGVADPDRLVKMGWSAGGHMTNKIITATDRFKAAASGAGAANWISMYAQSDIRTYRTPWFGGTPWQANAPIDVYWENSPLKYVSRVKTPTIFFVGKDDPRVPMPQSVEMYRALKSLGVPTHLYVAPREGHGWQELRHQLAKFNLEMAWFDRYALGRNFAPETAPETPSADVPRP
jgi:dipeptidyl aminopeptidase/acylaminoacyl peptidase